MKNHYSIKLYTIYVIMILGMLIVLNISPIPQDPKYHNFADQRQLIGIPHFWNVISNMPFIIVSFLAVINLLKGGILKFTPALFSCYFIFFLAIGAVGIGSAFYHLQPSNKTLLWDRLPMTIAFMAFMAIVIGEYISEKIALKFLLPLIFIGVISAIYWHFTEQAGHGDLRPYALVQFLPMLIIPMILVMFKARYTHNRYLWAMLLTYLMAKIFETFDGQIFSMISLSGHTIKHIVAALGPYLFFHALKKRSKFFFISKKKNNYSTSK
ncbi:MAG: ceramidase [Methylococcaceae bacterium]|nr:ceramidase [Methylococcaceae bacterium]